MKKLLLILLCLPIIGFGQKTYVPDDNFEQALINLGYDDILDDFVLTSKISKVTELIIPSMDIVDLTGLKGFISLKKINCRDNRITRIDISQNVNLKILLCSDNQIKNLYLEENLALTNLVCSNNKLKSLDLRQNSKLTALDCSSNDITSLNLKDPTKLFLKKDEKTNIHSDTDEFLRSGNVNSELSNKLYSILNLRINMVGLLDLSKRFIISCECRGDIDVRELVVDQLGNALLSKGFTVSKNTTNFIGNLEIDPGYEFVVIDSKKIIVIDRANKKEMGTIIISPKSQRFMGYFSGRTDTHLDAVEFILDNFLNQVIKN